MVFRKGLGFDNTEWSSETSISRIHAFNLAGIFLLVIRSPPLFDKVTKFHLEGL